MLGAELELDVRRGAFVRAIDAEGNALGLDRRDPRARLYANLGDRLVVTGADFDAVASVTVTAIGPDERIRVTCTAGSLPPGTVEAYVLEGPRASPVARAKRSARPSGAEWLRALLAERREPPATRASGCP